MAAAVARRSSTAKRADLPAGAGSRAIFRIATAASLHRETANSPIHRQARLVG